MREAPRAEGRASVRASEVAVRKPADSRAPGAGTTLDMGSMYGVTVCSRCHGWRKSTRATAGEKLPRKGAARKPADFKVTAAGATRDMGTMDGVTVCCRCGGWHKSTPAAAREKSLRKPAPSKVTGADTTLDTGTMCGVKDCSSCDGWLNSTPVTAGEKSPRNGDERKHADSEVTGAVATLAAGTMCGVMDGSSCDGWLKSTPVTAGEKSPRKVDVRRPTASKVTGGDTTLEKGTMHSAMDCPSCNGMWQSPFSQLTPKMELSKQAGHIRLFAVHQEDDVGVLKCMELRGFRVCLERNEPACPVFMMENLSYDDLPEKGKGCAVAVRFSDCSWKLGLVLGYDLKSITFLIWKGGMVDGAPDFFLWQNKVEGLSQVASLGESFQLVAAEEKDFQRKVWAGEEKRPTEFVFLNYLNRAPNSKCDRKELTTNVKDSCYQFSPHGPDTLLSFPISKAVLKAHKAPSCSNKERAPSQRRARDMIMFVRRGSGTTEAGELEKKFAVPYASLVKPSSVSQQLHSFQENPKFAVMDGESLSQLKIRKKYSIAEYNNFLEEHSEKTWQPDCTIDATNSTHNCIFSLINDDEFNGFMESLEITSRKKEGWRISNINQDVFTIDCPKDDLTFETCADFPGQVVCRWSNQPCSNMVVSKEEAELLMKVFPGSNNQRKLTESCGFEKYCGRRNTTQNSVSPGSGFGMQTLCSYSNRKNKLTPAALCILGKLKYLQNVQQQSMAEAFKSLLRILEEATEEVSDPMSTTPSLQALDKHTGVCHRAICTQMFHNTFHADPDELHHQVSKGAMTLSMNRLSQATNQRGRRRSSQQLLKLRTRALYFSKWLHDMGHFSRPTSCSYQFIGESPAGFLPLHFFAMAGLRTAVFIGSDVSGTFFGDAFVHCTALPLLVSNNEVIIDSREHWMFAWGGT